MSESTDLTYYQKNINVIRNRAKDYYKYNKERLMIQAREITMGRIDIVICLKNRNQN